VRPVDVQAAQSTYPQRHLVRGGMGRAGVVDLVVVLDLKPQHVVLRRLRPGRTVGCTCDEAKEQGDTQGTHEGAWTRAARCAVS
jgi:hypothetical protein